MVSIEELVEILYSKDNKAAYEALKVLEAESEKSNNVYKHFDRFSNMISDDNSYIRTRGLTLIAYNSKWDTEYKIDEIIDEYLKHILDDKPITSRQCIKVIPKIAKYKPELAETIVYALRNADTEIYKDSMQPLVYKDIKNALKKINE